MSEEEKQAYDNLIMLKHFTEEKEYQEAIDIILNLIEKQQKEMESADHLASVEFIEQNYIPKSKIKDKIKEIEEYDKEHKTYTKDGRENFTLDYCAISILQKLLESKGE